MVRLLVGALLLGVTATVTSAQAPPLLGPGPPGCGPAAARSYVRRSDLHDPVRLVIRAVTFLGLFLVFPCPWYMIAVGGVLPLPVIVSYGAAGGVVLVFSLVHLVVYTWIFHRVSRLVSAIVLIAHIPRPVPGIVLVSALPP